MLEVIAQIGIAVTGMLSIFLVAYKSKWGPVFGLLGEPFWLITAINNGQWGVILLVLAYTIGWGLGVYEWWFKEKKCRKKA